MDTIIDGKAEDAYEDVLEFYQILAGLVAYLKGKGYIRSQFKPTVSQPASSTSPALHTASNSKDNSSSQPDDIKPNISHPSTPVITVIGDTL